MQTTKRIIYLEKRYQYLGKSALNFTIQTTHSPVYSSNTANTKTRETIGPQLAHDKSGGNITLRIILTKTWEITNIKSHSLLSHICRKKLEKQPS